MESEALRTERKTESSLIENLLQNMGKVILGKRETLRLAVAAFLARGHALIEDVPGVGKTALARTMAKSISCRFKRIQFTPDLLPSDITGVSIFDIDRKEFVFKPGPIFGNIILADEINRTTPRTQSALMEAMNDRQVTVDGVTHKLPVPFMVIATQNPFEFTGTYPLPESQLDRFMMLIHMGYPPREEEIAVIESRRLSDPLKSLEPVIVEDDIRGLFKKAAAVHIEPSLTSYIMDIVEQTRAHKEILVGVSPRGAIHLTKAAQAFALIGERDYVIPDDIKDLAPTVLAHRLVMKRDRFSPDSRSERYRLMQEILEKVRVPQE